MREVNLRGIDLNLLVVLDHLLETAHVTRAAERAGMSQPAMSRALGRLRALLRDPLLARGPNGLLPTPRARAVQPQVKRVLAEIGALMRDRPFEPALQSGLLTLAATDHQTIMVLPQIMARISCEAPMLDVQVVPISPATLDRLAKGTVDLAFGVAEEQPSPPLRSEFVYEDHFVCLLRDGHPAITDWSIESFAGLDHVLVTVLDGGRGAVDALLEAQGLSRRIALKLPHFYAAIRIVAASDYLVTLPASIAGLLAPEMGLTVLQLPLQRPPIEVITIWADLLDRDAPNMWLRSLVREEARRIAGRTAKRED